MSREGSSGADGAANAQISIPHPAVPQAASQSVRRREPAAIILPPIRAQSSLEAMFKGSLYMGIYITRRCPMYGIGQLKSRYLSLPVEAPK
jgi:hypothetical protein